MNFIHGLKKGLAVFLNVLLFHHQTVCFGTIDCSGETSIFQALSKALSDVYVPALDTQKDWGEMSKSPQGIAEKDEFLKFVDGFVSYLDCKLLKILFSIFTSKLCRKSKETKLECLHGCTLLASHQIL